MNYREYLGSSVKCVIEQTRREFLLLNFVQCKPDLIYGANANTKLSVLQDILIIFI